MFCLYKNLDNKYVKYITNDTIIPSTWVSECDEGFFRELKKIEREVKPDKGLLTLGLLGREKLGL